MNIPIHSPQKMVTALGTHWHPEHFCCVSCGEPFGDEGESLAPVLKDTRLLDPPPRPRWSSLLQPPQCSAPLPHAGARPIPSHSASTLDPIPPSLLLLPTAPHRAPQSQILRVPGTVFFLSARFPPPGFHEREGRPYCRRDFLQLFAPRCQGCQGPILDNYISALSALWHPDCFVCRVRCCGRGCAGGRGGGGNPEPS